MSTASVKWSNNTLTISPEGFRWTKPDGNVVEGPWSEVRSVRGMEASASIEGVIPLGTWQHLGMELENGQGFYFHTKDKSAFVVAQLANRYATPQIVPKLWSQLEQGKTVRFGDITLSKANIGYKKKSWPLSELAGHKTYQGHWMMDIGPKSAPMLKAQIMISRLPNHAALRILLDQLRPGSEYVEGGPDLGNALRPSASSHDPRYPSGRQRLMLLGGLLGVGALIGLGALVYFTLEGRGYAEHRAAQEQRVAASMKAAMALPVAKGKPWACTVKTSSYDLDYVMRGPAGVARPGIVDKDAPFSLSGGGGSIAYGSAYFMFVELRDLTQKDAEQHRVATLVAQMIETKNLTSVCAGEVKVRFADRDQYDVPIKLGEALRILTCKDEDSDCKYAKESVTLFDPSAPTSQPPSTPASDPVKPTKRPLKKKR